jgi:hypothetical protein
MLKKSVSVLVNEAVATSQSLVVDLGSVAGLSVQVTYSNVAPSAAAVAAASVNATDNTFTKTAHGFVTGLKGQFTTTAADLPDGISTSTDYFIIKVDADTFKVATSLANAVAGTAVDLLDAGTGTHTFTATTSTSNVCKLQVSNDGVEYEDLGSYTVTIATSAGNEFWNVGELHAKYLKVLYTPSAGQINLKVAVSQTPL